jgi:hypothetical protein
MPRPRLSVAITWARFEAAVLEVFSEALRRLAQFQRLPAAEEPINLELYWIARKIHHELLNSPQSSIPFSIMTDTTNQPEPDDSARSKRMKKRPDFSCVLNNSQEADFRKSQAIYSLECKRLGNPERDWILNQNYAEYGMLRFTQEDWQYAKGCVSATMIGYLQNMAPNAVLNEVNNNATLRGLPSLQRASASWVAQGVTSLSQAALNRTFVPTQFQLGHLWVDLQHCHFNIPSKSSPQTPMAPPSPAKAVAKKSVARVTEITKATASKVAAKKPPKK